MDDGLNGSMDQRHSFNFLGLQGIPGLIPGPSGMHGADSFGEFTYTQFVYRKTFHFTLYIFCCFCSIFCRSVYVAKENCLLK